MALLPRASAKLIGETAKYISIKKGGIESVSTLIQRSVERNEFSIKTWKTHDVNPKIADESAIDWIFLIDTLNFSFWTAENQPKYEITFKGKTYTGYWALCAAINRAIQNGIPICNSDYYSKITLQDIKRIMKSDFEVEMPLLEERVHVLNETGTILKAKFDGSFVNCIKEANGSAAKLLELIVHNFPSYRDEADYEGKRVSFYKRAQILIGDIWGCFEGKELGSFEDIDTITMFADYRVPQVLVQLGAMEYTEELLTELKEGKCLVNGSRQEVEIRGCSIWAVEEICNELKKRNCKMNGILVDYYLWDLRRLKSEEFEKTPFHKTRCIYY